MIDQTDNQQKKLPKGRNKYILPKDNPNSALKLNLKTGLTIKLIWGNG